MSRVEKITESLEEWNEEYSEELISDELLSDVAKFSKEDFSITFSVDPDFSGAKNCSLLIPDSYPNGSYTFLSGEEMKEYKGNNILEVMEKVMKNYRKLRTKAMKELITPTPTPVEGMENFNPYGSDDEDEDEGEDIEIPMSPVDGIDREAKENFELLVDEVNKLNDQGFFCIKGASGIGNFRVYLVLDPKKRLNISTLVANSWGIDLEKYIVVSLTLSSYNLHGLVIPEISSFQSTMVKSRTSKGSYILGEEKHLYGLWWTISNRLLRDFFKKHSLTRFGGFQNDDDDEQQQQEEKKRTNFLIEAIIFVERSLKSAPYFCTVCGAAMEYVGIKPSVCSRSLCVFSHEEYGLGCDLESEIMNNSEVVDMLISMAFAVAGAPLHKFNPFDPFPYGIEVKTKDEQGNIILHNFLKEEEGIGGGGGIGGISRNTGTDTRDNKKVLEVVGLIPPLSKLQTWTGLGLLKKELDKLDPRMHSLIRWIVSSNRCHLHKLEKKNQISAMNTQYQYIMMSGTAEKESEFQQLKQQYKSIQAWHGSPLFNWHSILRKGLKNMSGKKGQLHGAVYGSGVYFAKNASSSFGYAKRHSGWVNSMFGNSGSLGMIALCEIINHPNYAEMPKPFYVIPEEKHIQTRLFFCYPTNVRAQLAGDSVTIPTIKWKN